jgi:hypothetical protein
MMKKTGIDSVSQRVLLALLEGRLLEGALLEGTLMEGTLLEGRLLDGLGDTRSGQEGFPQEGLHPGGCRQDGIQPGGGQQGDLHPSGLHPDSFPHGPGDGQSEGLLYEPDPPYGGAEQVALLEAGELVRLYRAVRDRMAELGMDPDRFEPPVRREPEVLRITGRYRIFLPERGGEELRLRPLVKTVFIFFLKHPEGIAAKGIGAFRSELLSIYSRITGREDAEAVAATVDRLVDVMENSFHENCSRLNTRLAACFPEGTLDQYQVRGARSGLRRIALEPMYVRWEEP